MMRFQTERALFRSALPPSFPQRLWDEASDQEGKLLHPLSGFTLDQLVETKNGEQNLEGTWLHFDPA